jgi:hypothetical protein
LRPYQQVHCRTRTTCHDQLLCEVLIVCPDRHKMTTLTPALHMESYSPDDNRFDLRFVHPLYISRHYQFPYVHLGKLGRVRLLTIRCLQAFSLPELHMGVQENREEYCDTRRARKEDAGCCGEQERDWGKKDGLNESASRTFCRLVEVQETWSTSLPTYLTKLRFRLSS